MRNQIIDNIRGLCLLGVIGIHVGSVSVQTNNFWWFTLLEILSRYSVPTFFFISGFGLFSKDNYLQALAKGQIEQDSFNYIHFLPKRLQSAGLPYLSWSIFYQLYFWRTVGYIALAPAEQFFVLCFGLSCYHLYFMVILLVFYLTHPLWRLIMAFILKTSIPIGMSIIFILQFILFYFSSHNHINPEGWVPFLKNLYVFRLNYVPLYYLFIYLMGGLMALYWEKVELILVKHFYPILAFYFVTILYAEGSAFYSYNYENYDLLSLAYTYHQLSPQGLLYTIGSIWFFCAILKSFENKSNIFTNIISLLAKYSMLIYFIHPLFLDIITRYYTNNNIVITTKKSIFTYVLLVVTSLLASYILDMIFKRLKYLRIPFCGK